MQHTTICKVLTHVRGVACIALAAVSTVLPLAIWCILLDLLRKYLIRPIFSPGLSHVSL